MGKWRHKRLTAIQSTAFGERDPTLQLPRNLAAAMALKCGSRGAAALASPSISVAAVSIVSAVLRVIGTTSSRGYVTRRLR